MKLERGGCVDEEEATIGGVTGEDDAMRAEGGSEEDHPRWWIGSLDTMIEMVTDFDINREEYSDLLIVNGNSVVQIFIGVTVQLTS